MIAAMVKSIKEEAERDLFVELNVYKGGPKASEEVG